MRDYEKLLSDLRLKALLVWSGMADPLYLDAADAIEELVDIAPKWVSVEERLPEPGVYVLFWMPGVRSSVTGVVVDGTIRLDEYGAADKKSMFKLYPSHWCMLPAPPKEVE